MSHCISAYIAKYDDLAPHVEGLIRLPHDYALVPAMFILGNLWEKIDKIAHVNTNYFGGAGTQGATYWENGEEKFHFYQDEYDEETLFSSPINTALRMMGVVKDPDMDEFDTINLGHYRSLDNDFVHLKTNPPEIEFRLIKPDLESQADQLILSTYHGPPHPITDLELLEVVARKLKEKGFSARFVREESGGNIEYSVDEILFAIEQRIEVR